MGGLDKYLKMDFTEYFQRRKFKKRKYSKLLESNKSISRNLILIFFFFAIKLRKIGEKYTSNNSEKLFHFTGFFGLNFTIFFSDQKFYEDILVIVV